MKKELSPKAVITIGLALASLWLYGLKVAIDNYEASFEGINTATPQPTETSMPGATATPDCIWIPMPIPFLPMKMCDS